MNVAIHLSAQITSEQQALIDQLDYDCFSAHHDVIDSCYSHILLVEEEGISLQSNEVNPKKNAKAAPTKVDFNESGLQYRLHTSGKSQGIAKAIGLNKKSNPTVLDATAGLAKDSFILASLGCTITLLERSPLVYTLLADGFQRGLLSDDITVRNTLNAMKLIHSDALSYFELIAQGKRDQPDVIYLDPMFPPRNKSAQIKKDMLMLQNVLGIDDDFEQLLEGAKNCAKHRVVVKRPGKKTKSVSVKPSFQIEGKSAHFDVYM